MRVLGPRRGGWRPAITRTDPLPLSTDRHPRCVRSTGQPTVAVAQHWHRGQGVPWRGRPYHIRQRVRESSRRGVPTSRNHSATEIGRRMGDDTQGLRIAPVARIHRTARGRPDEWLSSYHGSPRRMSSTRALAGLRRRFLLHGVADESGQRAGKVRAIRSEVGPQKASGRVRRQRVAAARPGQALMRYRYAEILCGPMEKEIKAVHPRGRRSCRGPASSCGHCAVICGATV